MAELNRTALRYRTLAAVNEGNLTMIATLWLTSPAMRTLGKFTDLGLVKYGERAYRLTDAGTALLEKWRAEGGESRG